MSIFNNASSRAGNPITFGGAMAVSAFTLVGVLAIVLMALFLTGILNYGQYCPYGINSMCRPAIYTAQMYAAEPYAYKSY